MKIVILIYTFLICSFSYCQELADVATIQNINGIQYTNNHYGNGMSFYDFNEDGWDDLTIPFGNNSIRFYQNNNGSFTLIGSPIVTIGNIRSVIWVDYDNDNDLDLCITYSELGIRLYQNDGLFNFVDITSTAGISTATMNSWGVSFADFNTDGFLDFYLCNYSENLTAFNHENILYLNQGNGTFSDITSIAGVGDSIQPSFMSLWYDFDEDNDLDLHVINDRMEYKDALYLNNNGTFTDIAISAGVQNPAGDPMGISISDFNNDGYQDVYLSDAGSTGPANYIISDAKLYKNQGGVNFFNIAQSAEVDTNLMGWGALWVDYNNDGYEDIYVPTSRLNGLQVGEETSLMFLNDGDESFTLINDSINADIVCSSYSAVKGDINNDGFYDIAVLNDSVPINLLSNSGNLNNYIKITPIGTISNRMAIGSKVKVYCPGLNQYQVVTCGSGLGSQNTQHMIFGLRSNTIVDSLVITFPSGIVVRKYQLQVNQSYEVIEQAQSTVEIMGGINQITLCTGDSLLIGVTGLNNYSWNNGSTDSLIFASSSGYYYFSAENNSGDTLFYSDSIYINIESAPTYFIQVNNATCGTNTWGSANLNILFPSPSDYTILWSNGDIGPVLDSAINGTYYVEMESLNGCLFYDSLVIFNSPNFIVQYLTTPVTNDSLGAVQFFIFGGISPFEFSMDGNTVSDFITDLDSGYYEILVTDANGCEVLVPFNIEYYSTIGLTEAMPIELSVFEQNAQLTIDCSIDLSRANIKLYSANGNIIADNNDGVLSNPNRWILNKIISQGLYILSLEIDGRHFLRRIFIAG